MAIYRKKGRGVWYAEVYLREQKRVVRFSTHKRDEAEAREVERLYRAAHNRNMTRERLHALLDALYGGEPASAPQRGIALADAFDRYAAQIEACGRPIAPKTLATRRSSFARFDEWRRENHPACVYCSEVTRSVAGRFAADFNSAPGLADKTKKEGIGDLGTIWNVLMAADETIRENPWRYFRKRVVSCRRGCAFSVDEERAVLAACEGSEWHAASVISRWTGLRLKDVCHLAWERVDFAAGTVSAVPAKTSAHGIAVVVPMSRALRSELETLPRGGEFVLPSLHEAYGHFHFAEVGPFSAVLVRAGLDPRRFTFHSWRHTFASRLADAGVSTELIKKMGGWTQTATALLYQHSDRLGELREAIRAVEAG